MKDAQLPFASDSAKPTAGGSTPLTTGGSIKPTKDQPAPWTVSALVARINEALLDTFPKDVAVVGQISNFKRHSSGHLYFSLKDAGATIDAVMFKSDAGSVRFEIADGLEVVARGRVEVYARQGRLQLYVRRLAPMGVGALELAFRQLKERLQREGLFDPTHKKPLVRFPRAIGVITSPTGAAIRDIARTLSRRWPAARVFLVPVRVQGESAADEIAEAVRLMDTAAAARGIDTILVARGGGSLEDLWAFNEEVVARAIFAAKTPIVSGVGHEVDFTIADFVADVRAATPTAAAELAAPDGAELRRHCNVLAGRLGRRVRDLCQSARVALTGVQRSVVFRDPAGRARASQQMLDELITRMRQGLSDARRVSEQRLSRAEQTLAAHHPQHRLKLGRQRLEAMGRQLEAMSYRAVLKRGYSVTRIKGEQILRSIRGVGPGQWLETELADGKIESQVDQVKPAEKPKQDDRR